MKVGNSELHWWPDVSDMADKDVDPAPASASVSAVSLKLPLFWPADPEVWFAQVEAQLTTKGVTAQKTRFDYVIASLSPEFATEVRDVILKPPTDHAYDMLKTQLIKRTAASEQRKLQQLFSREELGDRKPTQLLRRMQQLVGDKLGTTDNDSFLRELFLQRLPPNVRMILASSDSSLSLDKLAELADKVAEVALPTVATVIETPPQPDEVKQLRAEVARLKDLLQSMNTELRRRSPKPRRSPSPAQTRQTQEPNTLCWYHRKFGDAAQKCHESCSRGLNSQAGH